MCWGGNWDHQLGDGSNIDRLTPIPTSMCAIKENKPDDEADDEDDGPGDDSGDSGEEPSGPVN